MAIHLQSKWLSLIITNSNQLAINQLARFPAATPALRCAPQPLLRISAFGFRISAFGRPEPFRAGSKQSEASRTQSGMEQEQWSAGRRLSTAIDTWLHQ